jgi:SNF2 family DNA or RNA helicase
MISLYRHQEVALSYMRSNDYFALYMEMGTGKTLVSLFRLLDLLKSGKIEDALVVAPKSALGAWERDIELFDELDREILRDNITLINYDKVWRGEDKSPYNKKYGCIILDEAHNIKNRTSRRSKFLLKIASMSDYRYILTGTPIGNGQLENIWSLYCFLNPYIERGRV